MLNIHHVCLLKKKKTSIPLAEASPSAFTSVTWSCCVPSSSITATEKPTDIHNLTQRAVRSLILLVLFEISQFDREHCCSITTRQNVLTLGHPPFIINKVWLNNVYYEIKLIVYLVKKGYGQRRAYHIRWCWTRLCQTGSPWYLWGKSRSLCRAANTTRLYVIGRKWKGCCWMEKVKVMLYPLIKSR